MLKLPPARAMISVENHKTNHSAHMLVLQFHAIGLFTHIIGYNKSIFQSRLHSLKYSIYDQDEYRTLRGKPETEIVLAGSKSSKYGSPIIIIKVLELTFLCPVNNP